MPSPYPVLYRLRMDWWEENEDTGPLPELLAQRRAGLALDAGCGTGRHAVWLAGQGWTVIGVDSVARALDQARARAESAGLADRVTFLRDDVTRLTKAPTARPYDLIVDIGCYHSLRRDQQQGFAAWVSRHTRANAAVVIHAVTPRSGIGPHGLDEDALTAAFGPGWSITTMPSTTTGGGPLRHATFRWYTLTRSNTPLPPREEDPR